MDADAKQVADLPTERDECSLVHASHLVTVQMKADWREEYRSSPAYRGQHFLRLKAFGVPSHTAYTAIKTYGESSAAMARFCRAVLNHAATTQARTTGPVTRSLSFISPSNFARAFKSDVKTL